MVICLVLNGLQCSIGVMVPPVLADLNKDGTVDIIMAMFNTTVVAFDGETYDQIWKYQSHDGETYS